MYNIKPLAKHKIEKRRKELRKKWLDAPSVSNKNAYFDSSDLSITEEAYGIDIEAKTLTSDEGVIVNLNDVKRIVCELENVSTQKLRKNRLNLKSVYIKDIVRYYIKRYRVITKDDNEFGIINFLAKAQRISTSKNFPHLYCIRNYYARLQSFKNGSFPKDLYHPVKRSINGLFFKDDYRINDFVVESKVVIEDF